MRGSLFDCRFSTKVAHETSIRRVDERYKLRHTAFVI